MLEKILSKTEPGYWVQDAISWAIRASDEEAIRKLFRNISKIWDGDIYKVLVKALQTDLDGLAEEVLKHPSSPMLRQDNLARKASYLNLAIRYGRIAIFQHIVTAYGIDPNQLDDKGRTSLVATAEFDRIDMAIYLIENQLPDKWASNKNSHTPLSMAGRQGHEKFISTIYHEELNEAKVQEWLRTAQLRNASRDGNDQKVGELLDGGNLHTDELDQTHRSPWLWAVHAGHTRVVELLFNKTDINFLREWKQKGSNISPNALHLTAATGNDVIMQLLLQSGKFINSLDPRRYLPRKGSGQFGGTPLEIATKCENTNMAKSIEEYISSNGKKS